MSDKDDDMIMKNYDAAYDMIMKAVVDIQKTVKYIAEKVVEQQEKRAVIEKTLEDLIGVTQQMENEVRKDFDVVAQKKEREMENKSQVWLPVVPEHIRPSGGVSPQEFKANEEPRIGGITPQDKLYGDKQRSQNQNFLKVLDTFVNDDSEVGLSPRTKKMVRKDVQRAKLAARDEEFDEYIKRLATGGSNCREAGDRIMMEIGKIRKQQGD